MSRLTNAVENQTEAVTIRRIHHLNQVLQQALDIASSLDESVTTSDFRVNLKSEIVRLQELSKQRIRFIEHRVKERAKRARILAVDFSRQKL